MRLSEVLNPNAVIIPMHAVEKFAAIDELLTALNNQKAFADYNEVRSAVMDREAIRSTGIGQGFAIPHGKAACVSRLLMAVGKLQQPIDFQSIDGKPVSLIFLLISPVEHSAPHIQALARISRIMNDAALCAQLRAATDSKAFYKLVCTHDLNNLV